MNIWYWSGEPNELFGSYISLEWLVNKLFYDGHFEWSNVIKFVKNKYIGLI